MTMQPCSAMGMICPKPRHRRMQSPPGSSQRPPHQDVDVAAKTHRVPSAATGGERMRVATGKARSSRISIMA